MSVTTLLGADRTKVVQSAERTPLRGGSGLWNASTAVGQSIVLRLSKMLDERREKNFLLRNR